MHLADAWEGKRPSPSALPVGLRRRALLLKPCVRPERPGVADSLDEANGAFRAAWEPTVCK
jgi:hypothetical protein